MKRTLLAVALFTLSGAVFAQDPPPAPPPATPTPPKEPAKAAARPNLAEAAEGEVTFFRYCAACHGKSLKGDGPVAPGLVKKPIDLTALANKNGGVFPFEDVAAKIDGRQSTRMHGTPDMPVWGEIFALSSGADGPAVADAVKKITHYVWSKQTKAAVGSSKP